MRFLLTLIAGVFTLCPLAWPAADARVAANELPKVVSMNQCADELVLALADPEQVLSVSYFVKDPNISWDADKARNIPANSGRAEEIAAYQPDLVFAGDFSSRSTLSSLQALGLKVIELGHPNSLADVYDLIERVAKAVGHKNRGAELITRLQSSLAARPSGTRKMKTAIVYQPNGFTVGENSLINDLLLAAGLKNAVDRDVASYAAYPMEKLIAEPPDILILDPQVAESPSLAHEVLRHPALERTFSSTQTIEVPSQAWACGTHHVARAVQILREGAGHDR